MIAFWAFIIVLASVAVVTWPLIRGVNRRNGPRLVEDVEISELLAKKDAALLAISELESDFGMGSLSPDDYQNLRKKYEEKAVVLIKEVDELRNERVQDAESQIDGEIEARVLGLRTARNMTAPCPGCGTLVLPGASFCHGCGASLSTVCPHCSAAINLDGRFCSRCGAALSAGEGRPEV